MVPVLTDFVDKLICPSLLPNCQEPFFQNQEKAKQKLRFFDFEVSKSVWKKPYYTGPKTNPISFCFWDAGLLFISKVPYYTSLIWFLAVYYMSSSAHFFIILSTSSKCTFSKPQQVTIAGLLKLWWRLTKMAVWFVRSKTFGTVACLSARL